MQTKQDESLTKQKEDFNHQKDYLKEIYNKQREDLKQQQKLLNQQHITDLMKRIDQLQKQQLTQGCIDLVKILILLGPFFTNENFVSFSAIA